MLKRIEDIDLSSNTLQHISGGIVFARVVMVRGEITESWDPPIERHCPYPPVICRCCGTIWGDNAHNSLAALSFGGE